LKSDYENFKENCSARMSTYAKTDAFDNQFRDIWCNDNIEEQGRRFTETRGFTCDSKWYWSFQNRGRTI